MNERLNGDQQEALMDLQDILDRAAQLGEEAKQIISDVFPEELRGAEAYDVFNFGSSSNSYDNTLESLISDIEQRFSEDEGDDDLDEDEFAGKDPKAGSTIQGTGFNAPRTKNEDLDESIASTSRDLDKCKADIKTHLQMYKDAEGDRAKNAAVQMLKKLNDKKKGLEKDLESKVAGTGKGQELN